MIKKLHHAAYRCKDSEKTRMFYEDFLGLALNKAFEIHTTKSGRPVKALHTFYQLEDGSNIAFFEEPNAHFDFKDQRDFDLHIAFEVNLIYLKKMYKKGIKHGIETRGIIDHGFIKSIYLRDPNGYVIELTTPINKNEKSALEQAKKTSENWQLSK